MSMLALIRTKKSAVQERVRALVAARPKLQETWPAVGLLLIAPGMFGISGFLPHVAASHVSGLNLDIAYSPITHLHEPTTLVLSTMSVFGTKGQFSIRIGKQLENNFSIAHILPEPSSKRLDGDETIYTFSAGGNSAVTFTLMPKVVGKTAATVQYGLDPPIAFSLTTLP